MEFPSETFMKSLGGFQRAYKAVSRHFSTGLRKVSWSFKRLPKVLGTVIGFQVNFRWGM